MFEDFKKRKRRTKLAAEKSAEERNRDAQQAYRDRHGEDLRKARRVATALMVLRARRRLYDWDSKMDSIVGALRDFLSADEMKEFTDRIAAAKRAVVAKKKRVSAAKLKANGKLISSFTDAIGTTV